MSENINLEVNTVKYAQFSYPNGGETSIQGVRGVTGSDHVYISGSLIGQNEIVQGLIYEGPLKGGGTEGKWNTINFPSTPTATVINTSCYGPNNGQNGAVQIVGSYKISASSSKAPSGNLGFYYEGPVDGSGTWIQVIPNGGNTNNVFVHSIMGGIAVGNYDVENDLNGYAFLYDVATKEYTDFKVPNALTTTLYGIWHNGGDHYTLAGGYSTDQAGKTSQAFLVDYDSKTKKTSNLKSFSYKNETALSVINHFEGITAAKDNGYHMPADWVSVNDMGASLVAVKRNPDGSFGDATWSDIEFPDASSTTANTAYQNNILGVYTVQDDSGSVTVSSYVARVHL